MVTLKNNKDGCNAKKGETYSSPEPNTYSILKDGEVIGCVQFVQHFFGGTGGWAASTFDGKNISTRSYLKEIRADVLAW